MDGNLNCPLSVTRSAAFFCVRVLLDPEAPPSAGAHRPVEVSAPEGSVLNARPGAAVAGGNVETSSRVADLVFSALAEVASGPAQGQGTMNNLTLGGNGESEWTYYETLGGGQGACRDAGGPSAIHVAMSNTLNTPVEALESELPVRVRELSVRRGSGGEGEHRGGDGIVRELEALEPMSYSLITERRRHAPQGRAGGSAGQPGRNLVDGRSGPRQSDGRAACGPDTSHGNARGRGVRQAQRGLWRLTANLATSLTYLANAGKFRNLPRLSRFQCRRRLAKPGPPKTLSYLPVTSFICRLPSKNGP